MIIAGALLGLLLQLLRIPALPITLMLAIGRRYPWWMVTPDDPVSPFGQYEEAVRSIYARLGRYAGDVYWLVLRNALFGLAYWLKPDRFKGVTDYTPMRLTKVVRGHVTIYTADGFSLWQYRRFGLELLAGWMVRGAVEDPVTPRRLINMEFRPMLGIRRAG